MSAPGDSARARLRWLGVALTGLVLVAVGAAATDGRTEVPAASRVPGAVDIRPAYQGHYVTPNDVATLQANGLATASVRNRELTCQGIVLYFDTTSERDEYLAAYVVRFPVEPPYLTGDPCRPYRDSPLFVVGD